MKHTTRLAAAALKVTVWMLSIHHAGACPYCTIESMTLTEEIASSDVVVLARLIQEAAPPADRPDEWGEFGVVDPETGKARFRIERVLLGEPLLRGAEEIEVIFFGEASTESQFFIRGVGTEPIDWNVPLALSDRAVEYLDRLDDLPKEGPDRIAFFLDYLQHDDRLLAQDAYDEFARAPYADVQAIADQIDHDQLWQWIEDREISPNRRSLYFTMLGVCGTEEDRHQLRKMMLADDRVLRSAAEATAAAALGLGGAITLPAMPEMVSMDQRRKQLGFNAMVGCYLKLGGTDALDEVDQLFLANPDAHPSKVFGTLIALRFLAEGTDQVPLDRLIESMRLVLDKPDFAEQAITDLARWQDWSVLDRLVVMFKEAKPKTYVKEPIIAYLDQATQQPGYIGQRAAAAMAELEKLDPDAVKRSRSLAAFGFLGRARAGGAEKSDDKELDDPKPNGEKPKEEKESSTEPVGPEDAKPIEELTAAETETATEPVRPIDMRVVLATPLLATAALMALVWAVLRGGV